MQEQIQLRFSPLVDAAIRNAVLALLQANLASEGFAGTCEISTIEQDALDPHNPALAIWEGSYTAASPDAWYNLGGSLGSFEATADDIETVSGQLAFVRQVLGLRQRKIAHAYRDALRGIANSAGNIAQGGHTPSGNVAQYIADFAYNTVNAFPNSN